GAVENIRFDAQAKQAHLAENLLQLAPRARDAGSQSLSLEVCRVIMLALGQARFGDSGLEWRQALKADRAARGEPEGEELPEMDWAGFTRTALLYFLVKDGPLEQKVRPQAPNAFGRLDELVESQQPNTLERLEHELRTLGTVDAADSPELLKHPFP